MSQTPQTKALTIVDKSTKAFATAAANLSKVAAEIGTMSEQVSQLTTEIEFKQSELNQIEKQIETKRREAAAEIKLRVLEDEDEVLDSIMSDRGLAYITEDDLTNLRQELLSAQVSNQTAIDEAVAKAEKQAAIARNMLETRLKSEHAVEVAEYKANIGSMSTRIDQLRETNADLKSALDEERKARVEVARYSQAQINVPSQPSK